MLGYRDDAEDGWIPADEVRTELKVADVPAVDSPTLSYSASSVNASENAKVTVNGAGFQNISYNGSESLIVAVRAVDPATGKATYLRWLSRRLSSPPTLLSLVSTWVTPTVVSRLFWTSRRAP